MLKIIEHLFPFNRAFAAKRLVVQKFRNLGLRGADKFGEESRADPEIFQPLRDEPLGVKRCCCSHAASKIICDSKISRRKKCPANFCRAQFVRSKDVMRKLVSGRQPGGWGSRADYSS